MANSDRSRTIPSHQAALRRAQQFGHHLSRISVHASSQKDAQPLEGTRVPFAFPPLLQAKLAMSQPMISPQRIQAVTPNSGGIMMIQRAKTNNANKSKTKKKREAGLKLIRQGGIFKATGRPGFRSHVKSLSAELYYHETGRDVRTKNLQTEDLASPHRFPFADIRKNTELFLNGKEDAADFQRWTNRLLNASTKKVNRLAKQQKLDDPEVQKWQKVDTQVKQARDELVQAKAAYDKQADSSTQTALEAAGKKFITELNSLPGNVASLGPHSTVNNPVRDRGHLNVERGRTMTRNGRSRTRYELSPMSRAASRMSPHRYSKGIATNTSEKKIILVDGRVKSIKQIKRRDRRYLKKHKRSAVKRFT
ncbi:hypothetical protein ACN4EK_05675 [Pantanalinema rosaneae CENA516]|uniref:hypothetical protein n=1 Tax=Pantanalinema rosaneae TaxID=1620701 RepID=UPI003D6F8CD8